MKNTKILRWTVRLAVLAAVTMLAVMHQVKGGGPSGVANLHTICPLGGLETLYKFISEGGFIAKLAESNIILIAAVLLVTVFFGRFFCGWICSLGTLQDIFSKAGEKLGISRVKVAGRWDRFLRMIKFPVLLAMIYLTWKTGTLIISKADPFAAYGHIPAGWAELAEGYLAGFIILIVSLAGSIFIPRLFCRYLCPLGALIQIMSYTRLFRINRDNKTCISCGKCDKVCPVDIEVSKKETLSGGECITCYECVEACPTEPNALSTRLFGIQVKPLVAAVMALILFFGIIGMTRVTGIWKQLPQSSEAVLSGDVDNIRGWMSLSDVSEGFGLDIEEIYEATGLDRDLINPDIPLKEMDPILKKQGMDLDHSDIKEILMELAGREELISGSMTLTDIARKLELSLDEAREMLHVPGLPDDLPLRDLKDEYGFDMNEIREDALRYKAHKEHDCANCPGC